MSQHWSCHVCQGWKEEAISKLLLFLNVVCSVHSSYLFLHSFGKCFLFSTVLLTHMLSLGLCTVPCFQWFDLRFFLWSLDGQSDMHSLETALQIQRLDLSGVRKIWFGSFRWCWAGASGFNFQSLSVIVAKAATPYRVWSCLFVMHYRLGILNMFLNATFST